MLSGATAVRAQNATKAPPRRDFDTTSVARGTVLDSFGRPLEGVQVYVVTSGRNTTTDARGHYQLANLVEGPTRIRARRVGWMPADTEIVIAPHSEFAVNLRLAGRIAALDTVRVRASQDDCDHRDYVGFSCRRAAGVGVFRDSAELAAMKPEYMADLFDGIPGRRRAGHNVRPTFGWRCVSYLVNGHRPTPFDVAEAKRSDYPKEIVSLEFYADHENVPEWYKLAAGTCSLIVLWTQVAR